MNDRLPVMFQLPSSDSDGSHEWNDHHACHQTVYAVCTYVFITLPASGHHDVHLPPKCAPPPHLPALPAVPHAHRRLLSIVEIPLQFLSIVRPMPVARAIIDIALRELQLFSIVTRSWRFLLPDTAGKASAGFTSDEVASGAGNKGREGGTLLPRFPSPPARRISGLRVAPRIVHQCMNYRPGLEEAAETSLKEGCGALRRSRR